MASYNSGAGIGDNELARALKDRGTPVSQSTITRIANGKTRDPKEAQLKPLADFFGVSTGVLRGVEPRKGGKIIPGSLSLTQEAIELAQIWMQLSPARRARFREDIVWATVFEKKFPYYRIARTPGDLVRNIEEQWERMLRRVITRGARETIE